MGGVREAYALSIYLDHAATTPADQRVVEAMCLCMREAFYNPSAAYSAAGHARRTQRMARQAVAQLPGCDGGARGRHAVVGAMEHTSVLEAARAYASHVTLVPPDENGVIRPEAVQSALRPDTALVSVQWANNETGVLQPVEQIARVAHSGGALFHTDAVQAFGHVPVHTREIDLLSLSAHKFYGPRGVGCLYVRSGTALPALLYGGGQESGLRAGTENTPAICGLGVAAELAEADLDRRAQRERELMQLFVGLLDGCGARVLGQNAPRLPGVMALWLPGHESEGLIARLDTKGIQVSGGAACAAGSGLPSHVYLAMGLSAREARCVLRISPGRSTTRHQMETAAAALRSLL